jgi:hypothetical protein
LSDFCILITEFKFSILIKNHLLKRKSYPTLVFKVNHTDDNEFLFELVASFLLHIKNKMYVNIKALQQM